MDRKIKQLVIGLFLSGGLAYGFTLHETIVPNILFFALLIGSVFGLLAALLAPLRKFHGKGFMYDFYIPNLVTMVILLNTPYYFLGYVFGFNTLLLIIKNLLALEQYENNQIT